MMYRVAEAVVGGVGGPARSRLAHVVGGLPREGVVAGAADAAPADAAAARRAPRRAHALHLRRHAQVRTTHYTTIVVSILNIRN